MQVSIPRFQKVMSQEKLKIVLMTRRSLKIWVNMLINTLVQPLVKVLAKSLKEALVKARVMTPKSQSQLKKPVIQRKLMAQAFWARI